MRENCTSGIAPGAPGNRRSYGGGLNDRRFGEKQTRMQWPEIMKIGFANPTRRAV